MKKVTIIINLIITAILLIFTVIYFCISYRNDRIFSEKVIAERTAQGVHSEDKKGFLNNVVTAQTKFCIYKYTYNGNEYEFKVNKKDLPLILRLRNYGKAGEKIVILLDPHDPEKKIFAQGSGKVRTIILGLLTIIWLVATILNVRGEVIMRRFLGKSSAKHSQ